MLTIKNFSQRLIIASRGLEIGPGYALELEDEEAQRLAMMYPTEIHVLPQTTAAKPEEKIVPIQTKRRKG